MSGKWGSPELDGDPIPKKQEGPPMRLESLLTTTLSGEDAHRAAVVTQAWLVGWARYFLETCHDRNGEIVDARAWIAEGLGRLSAEAVDDD